jgi:hypothetical protein
VARCGGGAPAVRGRGIGQGIGDGGSLRRRRDDCGGVLDGVGGFW